jgi:general secretion pathway protein J
VNPVSFAAIDRYAFRRCTTEAAFTLVEVLVATTILSLIMLTTVTALHTLANTHGTVEKMTDRVDEVRSVSAFLRDILESTVVGSESSGLSLGGAGAAGDTSHFRHGVDFLEMKSTILFGEGYGGSYLVRVGKEGTELVLRWQETPVNGAILNWAEMPSRVVIGQLEEFTVATQMEYGSGWSDQWSEGESPSLVLLKIKAAGRSWPALVMQVQH